MEEYIDYYCERLEPGLWAEPINAITNASFFIAALMAFLYARRHNGLTLQSSILIGLTLGMGIGSTLFHTFASTWVKWADVLPILLYQISFLWMYCLYVMRLSVVKTGGVFALFLLSILAAGSLPYAWFNGSLGYAPALVFVTGFGIWHWMNMARERYTVLAAGAVFLISLTFRSVDNALCEAFPLGTHFLWHILNGVVLYLTTRGYIHAAVQRSNI